MAAGRLQEQDDVPLTMARDLIEPSRWNAWTQVTGLTSNDQRFGRDFQTLSGSAAFGIDRKLTENLVAGFSLTLESTKTDGFNSNLRIDTQGFEVGPYVAMRLSQHWAVDGSLSYGYATNENELLVLDGNYSSHQFGASFSLHGQYALDDFQIRPKATLTFNRVFSEGYDLSGTILNQTIAIPIDGNAASLGTLELTTEISRQFDLGDGKFLQPYLEAGAVYEYLRANDGKILDGNLHQVTPSPWSFSLQAGATALLAQNVSLDAKGGYMSFGQNGLDVWEGELRVAIGF
ncbi:autotransporter outer membrane beta-barrel domain-containing protein [Roseibium suaedae]|nr:autotransporter outer membrane beta-barrel domain-containing protein [Roseibium suaedae]